VLGIHGSDDPLRDGAELSHLCLGQRVEDQSPNLLYMAGGGGDDFLDSDVQFGVTRALVGRFVRHGEPHPTEDVATPWYSLRYTHHMERGVGPQAAAVEMRQCFARFSASV